LETAARHIPDDEIHAYLDQALSRSQCVEIECHLATCRICRAERDTVAAIRDRTTALLATIAPERIRVPPYEILVQTHTARRAGQGVRRRLRVSVGLIAAGIAAALGLTQLRSALVGGALAPEQMAGAVAGPVAERSLVAVGPVVAVGADSVASTTLVADVRRPNRRPVQRIEPVGEPILQVRAIAPETEPFSLGGLWQAVDLRQAQDETAGNLPKIDGLPIIDIQLQRGGPDQRPVVVVAQQHPSGRIIRTIEGPMDQVEQMLERQNAGRAAPMRASFPAMTPPDYLLDGASNARRGLRMLTVTGDFSADSLNALARSIEIRE
jgi:hypothetical protein